MRFQPPAHIWPIPRDSGGPLSGVVYCICKRKVIGDGRGKPNLGSMRMVFECYDAVVQLYFVAGFDAGVLRRQPP